MKIHILVWLNSLYFNERPIYDCLQIDFRDSEIGDIYFPKHFIDINESYKKFSKRMRFRVY